MEKVSKKLENWMNHFYNHSSDEDNKDSKLLPEFKELKKIIKEVRELEKEIKSKKSKDKMEEIQLCRNCHCMTNTKKGYIYICAKCGRDRRKEANR